MMIDAENALYLLEANNILITCRSFHVCCEYLKKMGFDPHIVTDKFSDITFEKDKISYLKYNNVVELFLHPYLNTVEKDTILDIIRSIASHMQITCDKFIIILKICDKLSEKLSMSIKTMMEKYYLNASFILATTQASNVSSTLHNMCTHVRVKDTLCSGSGSGSDMTDMCQVNALDRFLTTYLIDNIYNTRDACTRLSGSGVFVSEICKSVIRICNEMKLTENDVIDIVDVLAEFDICSKNVNKEFISFEYYMNIIHSKFISIQRKRN